MLLPPDAHGQFLPIPLDKDKDEERRRQRFNKQNKEKTHETELVCITGTRFENLINT